MNLDPNTSGKISVCSLHFKDGFPSPENPVPSEFLSPKDVTTEFKSAKKSGQV
jgi:hypothetical protein